MRNDIIEQAFKDIDLPYEVKQKARDRYEDLGQWLDREESSIAKYCPDIFPQGSFLLQTTIRPLSNKDEYDLDTGCCFLKELTTDNISQQSLKELLRIELESYRQARHIKAELDEKKRCWRLEYQDSMSFHIDVVPCLPAICADSGQQESIYEEKGYKQEGLTIQDQNLQKWKQLSILITDTEHPQYKKLSNNWNRSNPKGFAEWFFFRATKAYTNEEMFESSVRNEVEELHIAKNGRDTVLQRIVKLLKRHRDVMFNNNKDYAPISIIISKLAADAYRGERDLGIALMNVLEGMKIALTPNRTSIANPTEPEENYAEKWEDDPNYIHYFRLWLKQATRDFRILIEGNHTRQEVQEILSNNFSLPYSDAYMKLTPEVESRSVLGVTPFNIATTRIKPWLQ